MYTLILNEVEIDQVQTALQVYINKLKSEGTEQKFLDEIVTLSDKVTEIVQEA